jgi:uncharacterized membrane protein
MTDEAEPGRLNMLDIVTIVLVTAQAALAVFIWRNGPSGRIAVHFDLFGHPDGWADRGMVAAIVAATAVATLAVSALIRFAPTGQAIERGSRRTASLARGLLLGAAAVLTAIIASLVFNPASGLSQSRLTLSLVWVLLIVIGAVLGKTTPNAFIGVRIYWTLRSRLAWDKANRLLGRIMFIGGLIGVLSMPFVDLDHDTVFVLAGLLIVCIGGGILAIFESWRVWRVDPERIP